MLFIKYWLNCWLNLFFPAAGFIFAALRHAPGTSPKETLTAENFWGFLLVMYVVFTGVNFGFLVVRGFSINEEIHETVGFKAMPLIGFSLMFVALYYIQTSSPT